MTLKTSVLLVDDDSTIRQALQQVLVSENFDVVTAANGHDALCEFDKTPIDIVLLDLNLGPESGWDTFEKLRLMRPRLPIIMMTGNPQEQDSPRASGAEAFMEKPLDLPGLLSKMDELSPRAAQPAGTQARSE